MMPALERLVQQENGKARFVKTSRETIDIFSRKVRWPIRKEVCDAFSKVNRLDFLEPCFRAIDSRVNIGNEKADKLLSDAFFGFPALIWIAERVKNKNAFIYSTSVPLSMYMVSAGFPDDGHIQSALVIGSGSGFIPGVLSQIGYASVTGCEETPELASISSNTLIRKNFKNVNIEQNNAFAWIKEKGCFDTILVFEHVCSDKERGELIDHMRIGGKLVYPGRSNSRDWILRSLTKGERSQMIETVLVEHGV